MSIQTGPKFGLIVSADNGDSYGPELRKFLRSNEVLTQISVINRTTTAPPATPANGDAYLIAAGATGAWTGSSGKIGVWSTQNPDGAGAAGEWEIYNPTHGMILYSVADNAFYYYGASSWLSLFTLPILATVATSGSYNDLSNRPSIPAPYTLPIATASVLGGVKVGTGLAVDGTGVLSASGSGGSSNNDLIYIKDYAVGDGITNDTAAINTALALCRSTLRELRFTDGTYMTDGGHTLDVDGMKVSGQGKAVIKRRSSNSNSLFQITASYCLISGLDLDGNKANFTGAAGLFVSGSWNRVYFNKVHDHSSHGIALDGQTTGAAVNDVSFNISTSNNGIGISQNKASDNSIYKNVASGNGLEGITIDNQSHRSKVCSNQIYGNCTIGGVGNIGIDFTDLCTINDNHIVGGSGGNPGLKSQNNLGASNYNTVSGNIFVDNSTYQIYLFNGSAGSANWWVVTGNILRGGTGSIRADANCNNNIFKTMNSLNGVAVSDSGTGNT